MQCHLETSSSLMPNEIRRYNRTIDSYRPGEAMGEGWLVFWVLAVLFLATCASTWLTRGPVFAATWMNRSTTW